MKTRDRIEIYIKAQLGAGNRPTIRKIMNAVGLRSTSAVAYHLKNIETKIPKRKLVGTAKDIRIVAIEKLGGKCTKCGYSDIRALQIDHVYGGGTRELYQLGRRKMYQKVIDEAESGNYQVLCCNCNWIKRKENKELIKK